MRQPITYSFSARISVSGSDGCIHRADGESVTISGTDIPTLMADLSVVGEASIYPPRYQQQVLAEWFARKFVATRAPLRLVAG